MREPAIRAKHVEHQIGHDQAAALTVEEGELTKQAASQLVDDLEGLGVMARIPDPDDARVRRVVFTPLGREGLLEGLALLRRMEQELARSTGGETMVQLRGALIAILATLRTPEDNPVPFAARTRTRRSRQ